MNRSQAGMKLDRLFRGLPVCEQIAAVESLSLAECRWLAELLGISAEDDAEVNLQAEPLFLLPFEPMQVLLRRLNPADHCHETVPIAPRGSLVLDRRLKILVMARRVEAGQSPFHPDDLLNRDVEIDLGRVFGTDELQRG